MLTLFRLCTFLGAGLLFLVEPMAAKGLLPTLGGSPAVWTVSLVFYQALLFAGYAYAHVLARAVSLRATAIVHACLTVVAALLLPWHGAGPAGPGSTPPAVWLLGALATSVGAPFFVLSATGPLLQRWFAALRTAGDPYSLYAVSNASSLVALLAYPLIIERYLPLAALPGAADPVHGLTQNALWSASFLVFSGLVLACAAATARSPAAPEGTIDKDASVGASRRKRFEWAALSAIPASAMLGTTQSLTTDVASVPLLWILPLAVYLLTFVVAFAVPARLPMRALSVAVAVLVMVLAAAQWVEIQPDPRLALPLGLGALFAIGLLCHGQLARQRPQPADLTSFYLSIAAGGAVGSALCGLVAPLVFRSVAEYPLALALACLARSPSRSEGASRAGKQSPREKPPGTRSAAFWGWATRGGPLVDGMLALALALLVFCLHAWTGGPPGQRSLLSLEVAVPCLACALLAMRRLAFAAGVGVLFAGAMLWSPITGADLLTVRTFFGVLRVRDAPGPLFTPSQGPHAGQEMSLPMHKLFHGTTLHGLQVMRPSQIRLPSAYYHPSGPIGRTFAGLRDGAQRAGLSEVGVIGLGVGSLAAYAEAGEHVTFFEIDPAVVRIARDPSLFSYLQDCAGTADVVVGDGRIALAAQPDGRFGLLVIDAFGSDAVPVHLLTREALALVLRKLRPGGVAAFHLSNRFFDLAPVLAEAAKSLGKEGLFWHDEELSSVEAVTGKLPSYWAVVANADEDLASVGRAGPWVSLESQRQLEGGPWLWTDRYSSPLAALR